MTSTLDSLMEQALDEVRSPGRQRTRSLAYRNRDKVEDLPEDFQPEEAPTVCHFFGKLNSVNDFAVTDQDILQFSHRLQSRDLRPKILFDQFKNKRLLTLGCSFPGWLTRFFLAAAKGEELFVSGAPGVLADDLSSGDQGLVDFLERNKVSVYGEGGAVHFAAELHRRWTERFGAKPVEIAGPPEPQPEKMEPDSVFISFRREDRDVARDVAARFRKDGIDASFDETDLEPGNLYKAKITSIRDIAISPDRSTIASAGNDGDVRLWALPQGGEIAVFGGYGRGFYQCAALGGTESKPLVFCATRDGAIHVIDAWTGEPSGNQPQPDPAGMHHEKDIRAISLSPDGSRLVTAGAE